MKHLKTHKYPFNLLKVIYGDIISRDILSSLKSNPLTEQIFEIITYPYLSADQREYLRDFYRDFLTIQEISEKDKRDKAFVEDSINLAIKKLKEHIELLNILLGDPRKFFYTSYHSENNNYEDGLLKGYWDGHEKGYSDGYFDGCREGRIIGYDNGHSKGIRDGYDKVNEKSNKETYQKGYDEGYKKAVSDYRERYEVIKRLPNVVLEDLNLSVRAYNCLKRAGINTLRELALLTSSEMHDIKNFGKKSYQEVLSILRSYDLDTTFCESE